MRKLGVEAGVEAMALYKHVADKVDVLDGVVALLWQQIRDGLPSTGSWQERVRGLVSAVRAVAYAHPHAWGAGRRGLAGEGWPAVADSDAQFAFGLDLVIRGLETKLAEPVTGQSRLTGRPSRCHSG